MWLYLCVNLLYITIMESVTDKNDPVLNHYDFSNESPVIFNKYRLKLTPGPIFDMHLPFEMGIVLKGRMARYSGSVYFELQRGGVWFTGMLEPHGRQALEAGTEVAVFLISPDFFSSPVIPYVDNRIWQIPFNTPAKLRPILIKEEFAGFGERLLEQLGNTPSFALRSAQIQLVLLEILLHVNRLAEFKKGSLNTVSGFRRLRPALNLVFRSSQPVNTVDAAKLCKLSASRFSQLFNQAIGQSFRKFSLKYRLSQVALELKRSSKSLDELAEKWGFTDKSHLAHRFKDYFNTTPASYRKS